MKRKKLAVIVKDVNGDVRRFYKGRRFLVDGDSTVKVFDKKDKCVAVFWRPQYVILGREKISKP